MSYARDPRVDAYIDPLPEWQQKIGQEVRDLVNAADPEVVETIKRSAISPCRARCHHFECCLRRPPPRPQPRPTIRRSGNRSKQRARSTFCLVSLCASPGTLTFADITNLSANYLFTTGDCKSGSLRWTVYVIHNGVEQIMHVYYGNPNGPDQSCSGLNSGSGQNLITTSLYANRFEMQGGWGVAGPVYTTYADALLSTNNGTDLVVGAQLTLDSGFAGDQRANVSAVTVNDNTWVPKTTETTTTTTVDGPFAKTCTLPAAELRWGKNDATPTGGINEAESIQPKDTGQFYRNVDCKYIYNLAVSSLDGVGTYTVWVRIGGVNIQVPATFDLR